MSQIIEVKDLCHTYSVGTPFQHDAIQHLNFTVEKGEFLGIIGHTGSGKSTLIQHLNGLLKPSSGDLLLGGESIWKDKQTTRAARFRVGLVFQYPEYQLFEDTVYKDISFGPKNMGLKEAEIKERVLRAADFAGVDRELLDKSPFDLSGGQKRRVAIAGVIAMEPEVLILDEPTAGLDPEGREGILANIESYRQAKNATIMMVSHSMSDVARLAERLLVMNNATLAMDGTPNEVFARAQELLDMGLDIPEITRIFLHLQKLGVPVNQVYTVEQAVAELRRIKEGNAHA